MADEKQMALSKTDLSRSSFRGSGSQFRTDRLLLGKGPFNTFVQGQEQVMVEKVLYEDNPETKAKMSELSAKLNESLLRLVILGADNERMTQTLRKGLKSDAKIFENKANYDLQTQLSENQRLRQMLEDKEREVAFVREAEIRKSAIQSGDLSSRLALVNQENKRLQAMNLDRIDQINTLKLENSRIREESTRKLIEVSSDPRVLEMESLLKEKESQLAALRKRLDDQNLVRKEQKDIELAGLQRERDELKGKVLLLSQNSGELVSIRQALSESEKAKQQLEQEVHKSRGFCSSISMSLENAERELSQLRERKTRVTNQ
jgi:hypothetical protein